MGDVTAEIQREHRTRLTKEFVIIGSFYFVYSLMRNRFGSIHIKGTDIPDHAFHNAMRIVRLERFLGLFHEESIQEWFLSKRWFMQGMNTYYGTMHFVVTLTVFFVLFKKRKDVFPMFRNALAICTGLDEGGGPPVSGRHALLHRRDREPLLAGRCRRSRHSRCRVPPRQLAAPGQPASTRP